MTIDDLLGVLKAASPAQVRALKEFVAPETRTDRLRDELAAVQRQVADANARVANRLAEYQDAINAGTADGITFADAVQAFRG